MDMYNTFISSSSNCKTCICLIVGRKERYACRRRYYQRRGSVIVTSLSGVRIFLDRIAPSNSLVKETTNLELGFLFVSRSFFCVLVISILVFRSIIMVVYFHIYTRRSVLYISIIGVAVTEKTV